MRIHLHKDLLFRIALLNVLTKSQSWFGEMANINNNKVISARGNHGAGCLQISSGIHMMAFHAQHQGTQMLHGGITVDKQYSGIMFGTGHWGPSLFLEPEI